MVATNRALQKTFILPEEKTKLKETAKQMQHSVSELARRLITNTRLPDTNHHQTVIDLVKINGDLARLGNFLRMALSDEDFSPPQGMSLNDLINDIRDKQGLLKHHIETL